MHHKDNEAMAGAGVMFLSALIFGAMWYLTSWNYYSVINGQFLFFVALLDWTIKCTTIAFVVSGVITLVKPLIGNVLYAVSSLLSAASLAVVGVLDVLDSQHQAMHPLLLFVFAAWNGYGAWVGLRELSAARPNRTHSSQAPPAPIA